MVRGIPQHMVNYSLECRRSIAKSERHDSIFEKAVSATERRLPFISLLDSDEVVAILQVDFVDEFRSSNSFFQLIRVGEGVKIGDGDFVDCSIVNA